MEKLIEVIKFFCKQNLTNITIALKILLTTPLVALIQRLPTSRPRMCTTTLISSMFTKHVFYIKLPIFKLYKT